MTEGATLAIVRAMKRFTHALMILAVSTLAFAGCDKGDESGGDKDKDKKAKGDKPSLMLSNDTEACKQALKCCEAMVESQGTELTPEQINLSCSGVGMADSDDTCNEFKKGYAMSIEAAGKPVPDACK